MSSSKPYEFHPHIGHAYGSLHDWLATMSDARGYQTHKPNFDKDDIVDVAAQYDRYFPSHYFKVVDTLSRVVGQKRLLSWLQDNPQLCFVDVGCGAGAASAAFLEVVVRLTEAEFLTTKPAIAFVGVDPSICALDLYSRLMQRLETVVSSVSIQHKVVCQHRSDATPFLGDHLNDICAQSRRPCLPHVLIGQVNIARPLKLEFSTLRRIWQALRNRGISSDRFVGDRGDEYGVRFYRDLMRLALIDKLHLITIATDEARWAELLNNMLSSIHEEFLDAVETIGSGQGKVCFINPEGSFWYRRRGEFQYSTVPFHFYVCTITSQDLQKDKRWRRLLDLDNLMLAWARVRSTLVFRQPLCDETEIHLFEGNLHRNIQRLQTKLLAYAEDVARQSDRIFYSAPKGRDTTRPLVLSRMEEEILSVAIIQQLGLDFSELSHSSYAYRLNRDRYHESEYLYDYWFKGYQQFTTDIREGAKKNPSSIVVRVDIASYYTFIAQQKLLELTTDELHATSVRIQWLLQLLLCTELSPDTHHPGYGITQGGIGSGFYGNVYMSPIDRLFGVNNPYNATIFRYVDDIVLILPAPEDVDEAMVKLREKLAELDLSLNEEKTEILTASDYLQQPDRDENLDKLDAGFKELEAPLWIMSSDYRRAFSDSVGYDDDWWQLVSDYQSCLNQIGFHIDILRLSRKIWQYLWDADRRERDLKNHSVLSMPSAQSLPALIPIQAAKRWALAFRDLNPAWVKGRQSLYKQLVVLFRESVSQLRLSAANDARRKRRHETRIRFCVHRLCRLGLEDVSEEVVEILRDSPWLLNQARQILESLSQQGYCDQILNLLRGFQNTVDPISRYMRAVILRALRFSRNIEPEIWDVLIDTATSSVSSVPERLMATETWLYLAGKTIPANLASFQTRLLKLVRDGDEIPVRLRKNYMLILALCAPNEVAYSVDIGQDPMLRDACELAASDQVAELLHYPEPKLVRDKYYSGQYPDLADEPDPMY